MRLVLVSLLLTGCATITRAEAPVNTEQTQQRVAQSEAHERLASPNLGYATSVCDAPPDPLKQSSSAMMSAMFGGVSNMPEVPDIEALAEKRRCEIARDFAAAGEPVLSAKTDAPTLRFAERREHAWWILRLTQTTEGVTLDLNTQAGKSQRKLPATRWDALSEQFRQAMRAQGAEVQGAPPTVLEVAGPKGYSSHTADVPVTQIVELGKQLHALADGP